MTVEEIFSALQRKGKNNRAMIFPLVEVLIYSLYEAGYHRKYIADALHIHPDSVSYNIGTARKHLEIKDKLCVKMKEDLSEHTIEIKPYFEMTGKGNTARVRTSLYIDNIKF